MNKYELTLILDGKTTAAKKKAVLETVEKLVNILKGKMDKVEDWGVKEMFHQIKKSSEGLYLHLPIELEAASVKQLDTKLKMEENILRFLIIKI